MPFFDDKIRTQLKEALAPMGDTVHMAFFTQEMECHGCADTHQFLTEMTGVSEKLDLIVWDFVKDAEKAKYYKIDKIPAILLLDSKDNDTGIRFYGFPGGYEINSFLRGLLDVSGAKEKLPDPVIERIKKIQKDIHIQVFVSLTCPYCPGAVSTAHRIALENDHIRADMVESTQFVQAAIRYNVSSVPKVVINDTIEFVGAYPIEQFLGFIEKA